MSTDSRARAARRSERPRPSGRGSAVAAAQRAQQRRRTAAVILGGVAIVATVAVLAFGGGAGGSGDPGTAGYSIDRESFDLPALTGEGHVRLADHGGRPVVVNFFASWCVYCNQELPGFVAVARSTRGQIDFIGVQTNDTGDGVAMAQRFDLAGAGFSLARDVGGTPASGLWRAFGGQGLPATAFYDSSGKLIEVSNGMLTQPELEDRIEQRFGITVHATDAAAQLAPVIPLIPQGAAELMQRGVNGTAVAVIDARTPAEFAGGHLPGAVNLDAEASDVEARLARLPKDAPYILYCRTGNRSAQLAERMHAAGFKHVYDIQGGLQAWTASGLPTTTS